MNSNREKITNIVMVGVFAAVLAVLSQISFPLPSGIPVTLQTFAVALCGYALGCKRGTLAVLVYIVLGAVGLPVFANFSGGFGSLVGLAGGYIYGFLPMAALCGLGTKMPHRVLAIVLGVAGLAACHLCGTIQFGIISGNGPWAAFLVASVPYLVKDIVSGDLAKELARACRIIIPIKRIEIRKSEVLAVGEGEPESIMPASEVQPAEEETPAEEKPAEE